MSYTRRSTRLSVFVIVKLPYVNAQVLEYIWTYH